MNTLFAVFVVVGFAAAALRQLAGADGDVMLRLSQAIVEEAGRAVTLAFGLVGVMALFMGLMKVAEAGGLLRVLTRVLRRPMQRLFPQVPADHPAMGAMILNMAANVLGLGNAATPFGLQAMRELDRLNPVKGTASDAMVMFLAINTANVTLLPTNVIALRAAAGSADPAGVTVTTLFATAVSTLVAVVAARLGQRLWPVPSVPPPREPGDEPEGSGADPLQPTGDGAADPGYPIWVAWMLAIAVLALIPLLIAFGRDLGAWLVPGLVTGFVVFALVRRVAVYEALVEGAREGFEVAVRIIPYLVAILVAIGMLRASGTLDFLLDSLAPVTTAAGIPPQAVLMTVLRSLSGSGAYAYLASVLNDPAIGPDSYTGYLVSTIQGSTETTFYVLAVYCGAAGVRRLRHAVLAGLLADLAGLIAAVTSCRLLYGD